MGLGPYIPVLVTKRSWLRIPLAVLLASQFASNFTAAQSPQDVTPEQVLRGRAEDFYSLLQLSRWSAAEKYITPDSLESYRDQNKSPFLGFTFDSIKIAPNGQEATISARVQVFTGVSSMPMWLPRESRWKLVDGAWYVIIPRESRVDMKGLFTAPGAKGTAAAPPPEELKFKGLRWNFAMIARGQIKTARFPFTNVTGHDVTITEVAAGCDCLKVKLEKKVYKPGESGTLEIEFDPAGFARDYAQSIVVKTDPGGLTTYLMVVGYVEPPPHPVAKTEEGKKPGE